MAKKSAGILMYRFRDNHLDVLVVHPGGPFWSKKDEGVWSIPKGEFNDDETALDAAVREFHEEMGERVNGEFLKLTPVRLKSGKIIHAFALEHDFDVSMVISNTFTIEWPPGSGIEQQFPEVDRAEWVDIDTAKLKLNVSQFSLVEELASRLGL